MIRDCVIINAHTCICMKWHSWLHTCIMTRRSMLASSNNPPVQIFGAVLNSAAPQFPVTWSEGRRWCSGWNAPPRNSNFALFKIPKRLKSKKKWILNPDTTKKILLQLHFERNFMKKLRKWPHHIEWSKSDQGRQNLRNTWVFSHLVRFNWYQN